MKKRIATIIGIVAAVSLLGALAVAVASSISTKPAPATISQVTSDDPAGHDAGDNKGAVRGTDDNPATHEVGDDRGTTANDDNVATHDAGDDKGADNPATHDVTDDSSKTATATPTPRSTDDSTSSGHGGSDDGSSGGHGSDG